MTETENEVNEKTHIEALISEWKFQNAEGIYTFDRDVMFKHCFEDAYKLGKKELEAENDDIYDALNTQSLRTSELEAQIEKMKCWCNCENYLSCLEECCRKNISFEKGICYNCKKWELRR